MNVLYLALWSSLCFCIGWACRTIAYRREWQEAMLTRRAKQAADTFQVTEQRPSDPWTAINQRAREVQGRKS